MVHSPKMTKGILPASSGRIPSLYSKLILFNERKIEMTKEDKLIESASKGHLPVVQELLKAGADIHAEQDQAL